MIAVTFTDHRSTTSDSLVSFIDEHFPEGLTVDLIWTGQTREGSALLLLPKEPGHASISLTKLDVDGRLINADEATRIRHGSATDPFSFTSHTSRGLPTAATAPAPGTRGRRGVSTSDAGDVLERHTRLRDRLSADNPLIDARAPEIPKPHVGRQL